MLDEVEMVDGYCEHFIRRILACSFKRILTLNATFWGGGEGGGRDDCEFVSRLTVLLLTVLLLTL